MCGIAGIMFKNESSNLNTGRALVDMLDGCQHRGPDSTGFALYGPATEGQLRLRFFVGEVAEDAARSIARIADALAAHDAKIVSDETVGSNYRVKVEFSGDLQRFAYAIEHAAKVMSIGSSLEIVKDIGTAHEVDERYDVQTFEGSHGIGHVRLATESDVKPEASHPFWATGFADVAIVHNGQITDYYTWRDRLERNDYRFMTYNDSELIAVWISDQMSRGLTQAQALEKSISEIDGVFTFLISNTESMGFAKDRWAIKPLVVIEEAGALAVATEEQAVRMIYTGENAVINYDGPSMTKTWPIGALRAAA